MNYFKSNCHPPKPQETNQTLLFLTQNQIKILEMPPASWTDKVTWRNANIPLLFQAVCSLNTVRWQLVTYKSKFLEFIDLIHMSCKPFGSNV